MRHRLPAALLASVLALLLAPAVASAACTVNSNGTGGGDWKDAATWDTHVPTSNDTVCLAFGDFVQVTTSAVAKTLSFTQLEGVTVKSGGQLTLGSADSDVSNIDGSLTIVQGATVFVNGGSDLSSGGTGAVDNAGTLVFNSAGALSTVSMIFNFDGTVANTGPVTLSGGGFGTGEWDLGSGAATVTFQGTSTTTYSYDGKLIDNFSGGGANGHIVLNVAKLQMTAAATAKIAVAKFDSMNAGNVDFSTAGGPASFNVGTLNVDSTSGVFEVDAPLSAGDATISRSVTVNSADWSFGALHWYGGDIGSTLVGGFRPTLTVGTLDMTQQSANPRTTNGPNLTVNGPATQSVGNVTPAGGTTITIASSGRWNFDADVDLSFGAATLVNHGIIDKRIAGATNSTVELNVDSDGQIVVDAGILRLNAGFTQWDGVAKLTGGTYLLYGTLDIPGLGAITSIDPAVNLQFLASTAKFLTGGGDVRDTLASNPPGSTLTVTNGGTLTPTKDFTNDGTLVLSGGSQLTMAAGTSYHQTTGATQLVDGASKLSVSGGGTVDISGGTLSGIGTVVGDVTLGGTLSPGNSPGLMTIQGNYTQTPSGTLLEEIAGADPSQYDRLAVSGTATLAGTLNIQTLGGYAAPIGQAFDIITATARNGTFSTVAQPAGSPTFYDANYGGTPAVRLSANALSIADGSQQEGASGTTPLTFAVTLAQAAPAAVSVDWATQDGSAIGGTDYAPSSGTVTFAPGETTKTITVPMRGDLTVEPNDTFAVVLSNPVGTRLARASAAGTIVNDDVAVAANDIDGFAVAPPPVQGKKVNVAPIKGRVLVKLPGAKKFVLLPDLEQVPVGTIVDATHGTVRLFSIGKGGKIQFADFYEGIFQILQKVGQALTREKLVLGSFAGCPHISRAQASAKKRKRLGPSSSVRHLWGSGTGSFQTEGRFASATIRGTKWLTDDRCNGTLIRVTKGAVTVRDFTRKKTLALKAPKKYLAPARKK